MKPAPEPKSAPWDDVTFMEEINTDEGIELKILFNALKRNKNYILKFIFSGFIFGLIIHYTYLLICSTYRHFQLGKHTVLHVETYFDVENNK